MAPLPCSSLQVLPLPAFLRHPLVSSAETNRHKGPRRPVSLQYAMTALGLSRGSKGDVSG